MDEFYYRKSHVPAFGNWDYNGDYPQFTQCFESANQHMFRYSYSEDRDLYVAGDLYDNDVVTPAVIVVPRRRRRNNTGKEGFGKEKDERKEGWVMCECEPGLSSPTPRRRVAAKAVDEDLYKISPNILRSHAKRKRTWGFFASCLQPTHVC